MECEETRLLASLYKYKTCLPNHLLDYLVNPEQPVWRKYVTFVRQ